jgi:hypothetical protein
MASSRKPKAVKPTCNVSLHRNGLIIEVPNILLEDAGQMSATLLDAMRDLAKHYPEVVADGPSFHSGPIGEVVDDAAYEGRKRIGFLRHTR